MILHCRKTLCLRSCCQSLWKKVKILNREEVIFMEVKKEIFADNIGQISFTGGMVRFDYMTIQPGDDGVSAAEAARVIMPLQGFLNAAGSMQQLVDKLLEAGVLTERARAEEKTAEKPARKPRKKAAK